MRLDPASVRRRAEELARDALDLRAGGLSLIDACQIVGASRRQAERLKRTHIAKPIPCPETIERRAAAIRAGWSAAEERRRRWDSGDSERHGVSYAGLVTVEAGEGDGVGFYPVPLDSDGLFDAA